MSRIGVEKSAYRKQSARLAAAARAMAKRLPPPAGRRPAHRRWRARAGAAISETRSALLLARIATAAVICPMAVEASSSARTRGELAAGRDQAPGGLQAVGQGLAVAPYVWAGLPGDLARVAHQGGAVDGGIGS